ncbi:MAG: excinuclease ABC subunit UvrB [Lentisphaeria bacterium]
MAHRFKLQSEYQPAGDQPYAIDQLVESLAKGNRDQTLLGVTGSGKTFTLANVVERIQRPTLVISHNKTLAAQLYSEFKGFFPNNAVEYFVSYYDYYQPEAYIPQTDTYIAKDASINDEIERLRLAATSSLLQRRDVILVASVSCIYGLDSPENVKAMTASLEIDSEVERDELLRRLVEMQYDRNDVAPARGDFRASGDTVDIYPSYREDMYRVEFWGDTVEQITRLDPLTQETLEELDQLVLFPAKHFVMPRERIEEAEESITAELHDQVAKFEREGKLVEAQRLYQRTLYDLEMMKELGYCSGIENYSRHLSGRAPGSRPYTLLDFFPEDYVTVIDESHVTVSQIGGMFNADRSRKQTLVEHGFRLPSAMDNRPLDFSEFNDMARQLIYVSATPGDYELERTMPIEQVVRPTGLLDPEVEIRPLKGQVDDLIEEVRQRAEANERVLVTTLTKRTAEDLSDYMREIDMRVRYLHSEIGAIERVELIRGLRDGEFDCLIGINLLREGLDLPEVSLVGIMDADKEGFLRSERSLVQTAGRAARNLHGKVILYADKITGNMQKMLDITNERRQRQAEYNQEHNITPQTVVRPVQSSLKLYEKAEDIVESVIEEAGGDYSYTETVQRLESEMKEAADALEFERAAMIRDQLKKMETEAENDSA